ncbi:hypothetical protein [Maribacter polysiphoniae]|uniref:hypothetical protein n=1 Tax=Maribacter polysiphoniae TaxID=429344 RepID=UPI002357EE14|nr:hypothetical protein [Maribacter polysiphoniae]
MNKFVLIFLLVTVSACNENDTGQQFDSDVFPQRWTLVRMSVGMSTNFVEGDEMKWQETFVLRENGTFTKTRDTKGDVISASGTFLFSNDAGDKFLFLEFEEESPIIENCPGETLETYNLLSSASLSGGAVSCDGSALLYERVE